MEIFDMSEYTQPHTIAKLTGSPQGYIGYEAGGALGNALEEGKQVLVFDEIDKADQSVIKAIMMFLLDREKITSNKGKSLSLANTIVIMTSNAGASEGFTEPDEVLAAAEKAFTVKGQELWARITNRVVYLPISSETATAIADKNIGNWCRGVYGRKDIAFHVRNELRDALVAKGFSSKNGARSLRAVLSHNLEATANDALLDGQIETGDTVHMVLASTPDEQGVSYRDYKDGKEVVILKVYPVE